MVHPKNAGHGASALPKMNKRNRFWFIVVVCGAVMLKQLWSSTIVQYCCLGLVVGIITPAGATKMTGMQRKACNCFLNGAAFVVMAHKTASNDDYLAAMMAGAVGVWDWNHFSVSSSTQPRVLVGQFSGNNTNYAALLESARPIHKSYAAKWKYDYVTFQGVLMGCLDWHSTFTKIGILMLAMREGYDYLLLLDADAIIVDFEIPIPQLLPGDPKTMMLMGQKVNDERAWDINAGVLAFSLKHPKLPQVAREWYTRSMRRLRKSAKSQYADIAGDCDDQVTLHITLDNVFRTKAAKQLAIHRTEGPFSYADGTFVKHIVRGHHDLRKGWDVDVSVTSHSRLQEMHKIANHTREKYPSFFHSGTEEVK
jgi:hypothetical protein